MSDIQEPLIVLQRRMQQRQILAMMGIEQWVQPNSATLNITDIEAAESQFDLSNQSASNQNIAQPSVEAEVVARLNNNSLDNESADSILDTENTPASDYGDIQSYNDVQDINEHANEQSPVSYSFDSTTSHASNSPSNSDSQDSLQQIPQNVEQAVAPLIDTVTTTATPSINQNNIAETNNDNSLKKVAPFDLQGGRYGDWVILVDIQALNNDSEKLWQNITQALSITCETTSFPICEGMDTAELANASLAGYVFKIGRTEEIKVMSLTALPEGLHHPKLTAVPTLDEMLADSNLKLQLWKLLSSQS
ncbi:MULTISPECIES: hypothetical protein [unclassified Psychrobacter]|uniref:hypothetical protein n=1 Tax=unclassified Psychrobacter TaxID=196806 RepID=UPI00071E6F2C|nr:MULTISPECIES: hypothetical protein [unclassified Psychrobacter]OLF38331.1 hypothetical protein BTV98_05725 [Psychrobacter sp. Cmf 22.2]